MKMKWILVFLLVTAFGTVCDAQVYLVSAVSGKVYNGPKLLQTGNIIEGEKSLRSEKSNCSLKLSQAETNEDILVYFRNGHILSHKTNKPEKESELLDLTFNEFIKDYTAQKYLTKKEVFSWIAFLADYPVTEKWQLIYEHEKIPFSPRSRIDNNQKLVICIFQKADSAYHPLVLQGDSLLLGDVFAPLFSRGIELVEWKLKLATTVNRTTRYEDMTDRVSANLWTLKRLADETAKAVATDKSDKAQFPDRERIYGTVISFLNTAYGRVYEPLVKRLIDQDL